jgi:hypothetical protein
MSVNIVDASAGNNIQRVVLTSLVLIFFHAVPEKIQKNEQRQQHRPKKKEQLQRARTLIAMKHKKQVYKKQ